jgi:hypothetical protein
VVAAVAVPAIVAVGGAVVAVGGGVMSGYLAGVGGG